MTVDVVIVAYESESSLRACIAAVRSWSETGRVVVVDNASQDRSVDVARACADLVLELPVNAGFGAGQNAGVSHATTDWVLLLNPDAFVDPAGLESGFRHIAGHPGVAMVEGVIRRSRDDVTERWCGSEPGVRDLVARLLRLRERLGEARLRRFARLAGARDYSDRTVSEARDVDFLAAVAPLVRRQAFVDVGGFDESMFLYAEDVDLCRRLHDRGWSLAALPVPWADHVGGASSEGRRDRRETLWWESHRTLVDKHWTGPRRWVGMFVTAIGSRTQGNRG